VNILWEYNICAIAIIEVEQKHKMAGSKHPTNYTNRYTQSTVYSTDPGFKRQKGNRCGKCNELKSNCRCSTAPSDGIVRLQRQTKGRNGKPVVLITGLTLEKSDLKSLAKKLKSKCGVGGSVEGTTIIIQGDKRELLKPELEALGYEVKISGG
jgi:translation initiation factor 1